MLDVFESAKWTNGPIEAELLMISAEWAQVQRRLAVAGKNAEKVPV